MHTTLGLRMDVSGYGKRKSLGIVHRAKEMMEKIGEAGARQTETKEIRTQSTPKSPVDPQP